MAINFPDSPTEGDKYTVGDRTWEWNGTYWKIFSSSSGTSSSLAFDDLSDVDMTIVAPSEGDIAYFDGAKWVAQPWKFTSGTGVTVTSATDGQILVYDSTTSDWVNTTADFAPTNSPTFTGYVEFTGITDFTDSVVIGIDALPGQTGQAGKYLTTDGTDASWAEIPAASPHPFSMIG